MLYVYVTDQCLQDAERINTSAEIESLRQKLTFEQSTLGLERHPYPFLKKRIGRTRVVMAEVVVGEDLVVCFLRHVYKKDIGEDYNTFFQTLEVPQANDPGLVAFLTEARATPVITKEPPNDLELGYLILDRGQEIGQLRILESPLWIDAIRSLKETQGKQGLLAPIWEVLQEICDDDSGEGRALCERRHHKHNVRVLFRYFSSSNALFLVAPLEGSASEQNLVTKANSLLSNSEAFNDSQLLRNAARAYPDFILYDREIWESTQASVEANLALSPEESEVLSHVLDTTKEGGFPLFINGRPGSGKSTILQYLFAEYLHTHLSRPTDRRLPRPPLYLTYNERLLESARKLVNDIFHCGAEKLATSDPVDLRDNQQKEEFNRAFVSFREFLLSLLDADGFDANRYVDFHRFRALYTENISQGPDSKLRRLAPEVAWHTVRTYIKGKNAGKSDYFDPESYAELPRDEITVTPETFELIWDKVWNGWYRILCEQEGYWDDQDLARRVLDRERVPPGYPAVFCDEAQDFTTVELELIFRLSCFASKRIDDPFFLKRIPYAFAGDPFQTLNPTGFRWDSIKATFHDNIARQLDPDRRGKVSFTFKELAYNYRSTIKIVRFCNLIQLKRAELFDISDVAPQKAWAIDKGAWPVYFELDLGTQGKLKEQSELIIIVPCQEGEEKTFVERDAYLRTIALDEKGAIARNVLSPMRAKGLEFGRVVLYKFGEQAVVGDHVEVIRKIIAKEGSRMAREHTLSLEYYFNGLYVAASRAQRRLLIVDTNEGIQQFWDFATDTGTIRELLTERRKPVWAEADLHHMMRGDSSTWSEDRDDPKALADRFFEQGKLEESSYLLQLARNQYASFGETERQERCTALIHDLAGEYIEAAHSYNLLGEFAEAIRCYWEAKNYTKISETSAQDSGRFSLSPFVVAARFLNGKRSAENATQFIKELYENGVEKRRAQFKCTHWAEVFQVAVRVLAGDPNIALSIAQDTAKEVFSALSRMQADDGLILEKTRELALLAFNAGNPNAALDIWSEVKRRTGEREPVFVVRARAMTAPYPEKLRWYSQLGDHATVVDEYKAHSSASLEDEYRRVVTQSLIELRNLPLAVDLVKQGGSWSDARSLLLAMSDASTDKDSARALLGTYLQKGLENCEFKQVIKDISPGVTEIPVLASLLSDERYLLATEVALIKLLARSQTLVNERSDGKEISDAIYGLSQEKRSKLNELVFPEEVGAALERAGRMDSALKFYESVFNAKRWGADKGTELNAKERWLKCKSRQADLDRKDKQRKEQRLAEVKHKSAEWGIPIPKDEFPSLQALNPHEVDSLWNELAKMTELKGNVASQTLAPEGGASDFEQLPGPVDMEAAKESPRVESGVADPLKGEMSKGDGSTEVETKPAFTRLQPRPPFDGRIEFTFSCEEVHVNARLLPRKRRLELRDNSNDDFVMIMVIDRVVESHDLQVSSLNNNSWRVDLWALTITLVAGSDALTVVDFSDSEGRRILCLAL